VPLGISPFGSSFVVIHTYIIIFCLVVKKENKKRNFRSSDVVSKFKGTSNTKAYISHNLYKNLLIKKGSLKKNDILITGGWSIGIPYIVPDNAPLYFKDADLLWIKSIDTFSSKFLFLFFSTQIFRKYLSSITHIWTISHYTIEQAKQTPIKIPNLLEQQKIADFLSLVDEKIESLEEKKKSLEEYKKWMMQKIFSQEVGFRDENGENFGDWEEKRLGEIWNLKNGYSFKSSEYNDLWKFNVITISNVKWWKYIDYVNVNKILKVPTNIANHQVLRKWDLLISLTWNVWRVSSNIWLNNLLNQRVWLFEINISVDREFIYQIISQKTFEESMILRWQWAAQANIWKKDVESFNFLLPSLPEQQKIADFLSDLNEKIESVESEVEGAREWKKWLLQRLFV